MTRRKWVLILAAGGLLATTAAAGASSLIEKVSGVIHNEVAVSVNGERTALHPVYINGKAYLPARETADALGYDLAWTGRDEIGLTGRNGNAEQGDEEADYLRVNGVIVDVTPLDNGSCRLEVLGHGPNNWIMLTADKDTVLTGDSGQPLPAAELKAGMHITAEYGPLIALSFPGQSHAVSIQAGIQRLIAEQPVYAVEKTEDGWQLQFSELQDGVETPSLTLNAGKETMLVTPQGQSVDWTQIKPGTKVRAYYGPFMTKSLPPQSPADVIVVPDEMPDAASVKEYRELAWTFVPDSQKEHLLTKKEEAQVSVIDAKGAAIIPADDKQKEILADLQARSGKLISVHYSTDQDALLGPLMVVVNPDTKELVGFFMRR